MLHHVFPSACLPLEAPSHYPNLKAIDGSQFGITIANLPDSGKYRSFKYRRQRANRSIQANYRPFTFVIYFAKVFSLSCQGEDFLSAM